jgi:VWFA-related protein
LLVLAAGAVALAQQTPMFRASTRVIVQTIIVKDKDGKPVEGLTAKDFIVTEDGEPQEITFVQYQQLDTTRPTAPPPPPQLAAIDAVQFGVQPPQPVTQAEISSGSPGEIRYQGRRLLILYFDSTALPPSDLIRAYNAAMQYVETQMAPADLMAVMSYGGGGVRVRQDFTDNRERLQYVIRAVVYGEDRDGDGLPDPVDGGAFGQGDAEFTIFNTDRQLAALQTAVNMLRSLPEQKSLVYFASGLRLNGVDNQAQLRATTNAAIRANVSIFPVDARGLVASAPLGDATQRSPGGVAMFSGRLAENMQSGFQRSQDSLYSLAKDTGGKALLDYNDLARGIAQAADAITSYYILGYRSTHTANDGKLRRVKITLAAGLTAEMSYRQGYYADKEFGKFTTAEKERQLEEALMLQNPVTEISIAMEINYFQLNSAEYFVPVAVKMPGSELALARRGGAVRALMDFIGEVKDDYGNTIQNVRDKIDRELSDYTVAQLALRPIQYETGFTLLPGKYVLKFLVRDANTGRIGTFQAAFTVPNLNKEEKYLPMSSVVLSSQREPLNEAIYTVQQKNPTLAVNPLVDGKERLIPSVTRVFSRARELYVYLQAYERNADTTRPLVAFATFYQGPTKVFESTPAAVTDGINPRSKAVPVRFTVPLETLEPGRYECQVTVLDSTANKVAFWRAPVVIVQ